MRSRERNQLYLLALCRGNCHWPVAWPDREGVLMIWYLIGFLDALACGFVILCGYGAARKRANLAVRQMAEHESRGRNGQKPHKNTGQNSTENGTELTENYQLSDLLLQDAQRQVTRLFKGKT